MSIFVKLYGEQWTLRNIFRRITGRKPILKRKKPKVGYFPLPNGKIVSFEEYVHEMGETPDLLEARPPGWDENKEERRINKRTRSQLFRSIIFSSMALFFFSYGYNQLSLMQNYLHESQYFMQIKYMPDYFNSYGHVQLAAKYGLAAATAMFVPYLLRSFQDKWILFVTTGAFGIFVSLGFLDAKYTIMPSGIFAGVACLPFFISYSMYMVHIAQRLGDLNKKRPYNGIQTNWLLYKFNSFSFFLWFLGLSLSSVTSSALFRGVLERNNSYIANKENYICGRAQCDTQWPNWWDTMMYQPDISPIEKYAYANIVNASLMILAMAIFLFGCMDGQTAKTWSHLKDDKGFELNFKLGWRAVFNRKRTMLAPIFIFTGWSLDFILYTFPRAFHICAFNGWSFFLGISSFGLFAAISSAASPWLARKNFGWNSLLIASVCFYFFVMFAMIFWDPLPVVYYPGRKVHHLTMFEYVTLYALPGVWGVAFGVFHSAINVKIEFEYPDPDEMVSMFSLYHHWKAVGVVIGFATRSTATCTGDKIYALMATLILGIALYVLYEHNRLKENPKAIKADKIRLVRFLPNPNPEEMENESDVEEEGVSTSEEEEDTRGGTRTRRRKKVIRYKRKLPPNDPKLGKAWRTPHFPPDLEIPRKYITPDGHILIMPKHEEPPFKVQDAFDSNVLRNTNTDRVTAAARKVCFQLGYGGKPLFYDVDEVLEDERETFPCKFDARGNVIEGKESEPDFYESDLASNPRHNFLARIAAALEQLRLHRVAEHQKKLRMREEEEMRAIQEEDETMGDETSRLIRRPQMH